MSRFVRRFRWLFAVFATVQAAAPPAAALADACVPLAVAGRTEPADHAPAGHQHGSDCIFCQFLGHHALAAQGGTPEAVPVRMVELPVLRFACVRLGLRPHLPDARAPPLA